MLHHPTYEGLRALRLDGMAETFAKLEAEVSGDGLSPAEWLGPLVDRERSLRETKRYERRLREARLRHAGACPESVDYLTRRGLDRGLFERFCCGRRVAEYRNLILTGSCGVGGLDWETVKPVIAKVLQELDGCAVSVYQPMGR